MDGETGVRSCGVKRGSEERLEGEVSCTPGSKWLDGNGDSEKAKQWSVRM